MASVSRAVIVPGWRSQIRSRRVTTVATPGATRGATLAKPCTTSSPRAAAALGIVSHCPRAEVSEFQGGP